MSFYLILLGIAVLGIIALLLIFWERIKWLRKKSAEKAQRRKTQLSNNDLPFTSTSAIEINQSYSNSADPALADLGFSALDNLLPEVEKTSTINTVAPKSTTKKTAAEKLIVLYIMSKPEQPFLGYELLQALTAAGLHYGKLNIFHYYEKSSDNKDENILFSLASAVEPGIIDVDNIGAFTCPGLTLFMHAEIKNPEAIFELMLQTAEQLAEDLGGTICNELRKPLHVK